jgi:FtsH-binding integral membrane protein
MELFNRGEAVTAEQEASMSKTFLANVFSYMFAALAISGVMAWWFSSSAEMISLLYNLETGGHTPLGWIVMFAPFAFILLMNFGMNKLSSAILVVLFIAFSAIMGMSLSYIFLIYTSGSIFSVFLITSLTFGVMAVVGYTTNTDLTKFGGILMMLLIGLVIAMVVNMFMQSSGLDYIISIVGVLIFTGLIAYETQQLKRIGSGVQYGSEAASKLAIMGAMSLYLSFINLFLFLLRLLGDRN